MKIDWAYMRKGWVSCKKAWGALEQKKIEIDEEVNASKDTIKGNGILDLVKDAEKVIVASGKKILDFDPAGDTSEMLAKMSGRTGNLRAPTIRCGKVFYVGFNEELYQETIG